MEYRVRWETDLEAESPLEAAKEAERMMTDPLALAPILEVFELEENGTNEPDMVEVGLFDLEREN